MQMRGDPNRMIRAAPLNLFHPFQMACLILTRARMTRPEKISADWLTRPATKAVMDALEAARPGGARFVGGCVRNHLRGMVVDDIDIATQLTPEAAMAALDAAGVRVIATGFEHGTVTAISGGAPYEITSLRRDVETDGRRAVVAFTEDWAEDALRRDFRMNAIYAGADGTMFAPIEGSIEDAVEGRVVFIGDGDARLREDYLRALRFFRFNAWYGAKIDEEGLEACARQKDGLQKIAAERIWKELKKTLAAPDPSAAMTAMDDSGVLGVVLPNASTNGLPALIAAELAGGIAPDPMRRLMAMTARRLRDVAVLAEALKISNAERTRLEAWADPGLPHVLHRDAKALRATLYEHGSEAVLDRGILEAADQGVSPADLASAAGDWVRPVFPIGGDDMLSLGLSGPEIGGALRGLEQAWIENDFTLTRAALLGRLKRPGSPEE